MKNRKINPDTINRCIDTACICFIDYPLNAYLYQNIENSESFYRSQSRITLKKAINRKELRLLDNDPRALMFIRYGSLNALKASTSMIPIFARAFIHLKSKDLRLMLNRYKKIKLIYKPRWQEAFVGKDYYHLVMICVHPELKGSGAFRKLIQPLLDQADAEAKPIILETHNPELVSLYEHFGFTLAQTLSDKRIELKQYCLVRYPKQ